MDTHGTARSGRRQRETDTVLLLGEAEEERDEAGGADRKEERGMRKSGNSRERELKDLAAMEDELSREETEQEEQETPWTRNTKQRQVNYGRLCTLIIREGTKQLRRYVINNLPEGTTLSDKLMEPAINSIFAKLRKTRKLQNHQYTILYPNDGGKANEQDIDISLWVILARNLVRHEDVIHWDREPDQDDDLVPHHILRLRNLRNELLHVPQNEVSDEEFMSLWQRISRSLRRLGATEQDLESVRTADMDPEKTKMVSMELRCESLSDRCDRLETEVSHKHCLLGGFVGLLIVLVLAFVGISVLIRLYSKSHSCAKNLQRMYTTEAQLQFMPRSGWGAKDPVRHNLKKFLGPVNYLVVSQTAINGDECFTTDKCCASALDTQAVSMDTRGDVLFSYMIGGDGVTYEGRGQFFTPATVPWMDSDIISIAFMGYFTDNSPGWPALHAAEILIQHLVDSGALSKNATVVGLCQMWGEKYPRAPGVSILNSMKTWKGHRWSWRPINITHCEGQMNSSLTEQNSSHTEQNSSHTGLEAINQTVLA